MAEERPPEDGSSWGNIPPPEYFQQPTSFGQPPNFEQNPAYGRYHYGPKVDFEVIGRAWNMISSDLGTWVGAGAIAGLLYYGAVFATQIYLQLSIQGQIMGLQHNANQDPSQIWGVLLPIYGYSLGIGIAAQVLLTLFNAGMMEMALRRVEGRPVAATDVFLGFRHFLPILFVSIVASVGTMVGYVFCFVPGLLFSGLVSFFPILIVRGQCKGFDALGRSWDLLKSSLWMIALLVFCTQVLAGLGVMACLVGSFFTLPLYAISIALTYAKFFPPVVPGRVQEGGPSNYFRP